MSEPEKKKGIKPSSVSFTAFVLSLSTAALQQLGVRVPEGEDPCVNIELAKQTIDVLDMLDKKTQGNLTDDERKLLTNILYDLRLRFVEASRKTEC